MWLILVCLAAVSGSSASCPTDLVVEKGEGNDFYSVSLDGHDNVLSWSFNDITVTAEEVIEFDAKDCDNTEYVASVDCLNLEDRTIVNIDITVNIEPIEIEDMAGFSRKAYGTRPSLFVNSGDSVTLTCQTAQEIADMYDFQPVYHWNTHTHGAGSMIPGTGSELVLDSVGCSDAGGYICEVKRCSYHRGTAACSSVSVAVQQEVPVQTSKRCQIFGDPHVLTFDGSFYAYKGECWYVLAMDGDDHKWFVYGQFTACGSGSSCLESVSVVSRTFSEPGGIQIQILRGFALNVMGEKRFLRREEVYDVGGNSVTYTGKDIVLTIPEYELEVSFNGLTSLKIVVNKDKPTLGLCGDNDGNKDNDFNTFFDNVPRSSDEFADIWSLGKGCRLSSDLEDDAPAPLSLSVSGLAIPGPYNGPSMESMPLSFIKSYCRKSIEGTSLLKYVVDAMDMADRIEDYIEACASDLKGTGSEFFSRDSFAGCIPFAALAAEAPDYGLCIGGWEYSVQCPRTPTWKEEAVRIGCIWTQEQADIVLNS